MFPIFISFLLFMGVLYLSVIKDNPILAIFSLIIPFLTILFYIAPSFKEREAKRIEEQKAADLGWMKTGPRVIGKNDIGCIKYQFKESIFFKCPENLNTIVEVQCQIVGKTKNCFEVYYPVIK